MYRFRDGTSYSMKYYMVCGDTLMRVYDCKHIRKTDDLISWSNNE